MNQRGVHKTANESGVKTAEPLPFPRTLQGQRAERKGIKITRATNPSFQVKGQRERPAGRVWGGSMRLLALLASRVLAVGAISQRLSPFFSGALTRKNTDFDEHPE